MEFYKRVFALAATAILGWLMFRIVQPFLGAILWAGLLAFLLAPLRESLARRLKGRTTLAALAITIATTLVLVVPTLVLVGVFVGQSIRLMASVQEFTLEHDLLRPGAILEIPWLAQALEEIEQRLDVTHQQVALWINNAIKGLLRPMVSLGSAVFSELIDLVVQVSLTLFILFFFLVDGPEMVQRLRALVPMQAQISEELLVYLGEVTRAVVFGSLLTALAQGVLVGIGFAIVGQSTVVVISAVAAVAALLPPLGAALVWFPGVIWLLYEGRPWAAAFLLLWGGGVVSAADNLLRPILIGGRAQISTLPVFIGVVGGVSAFGLIGLFLGPVLLALVLSLVRYGETELRRRAVETVC